MELREDEEVMPKLELLTPAAVAYIKEKNKDLFSFAQLIPRNYFEIIGEHIFSELDVEKLSDYIGYDKTAPLGDKTPCAVCISDMVCDKASADNPEDEELQLLLAKWKELEDACSEIGHQRKHPSEIVKMKKEIDAMLGTWTPEKGLPRLQKIFLDARKSLALSSLESANFMPRYVARIYMREQDGHQKGEIQEKDGQAIRSGSFVAVRVSSRTCFSRVAFTLGLEPGYHVLAGCGNSDNSTSHIHSLRNIRLKITTVAHRFNNRQISKWHLLYAQTYDQANKIKELNSAEPKDSEEKTTLQNLWSSANSYKPKIQEPEIWITGVELEKELGQPDPKFRHTVRAIAVRKSRFSGEYEVLTVTERGDNASEKTGKPPLIGVPGGMREKDATLEQTLCRETQNEAQTKSVDKIIALVAIQKKQKRSSSDQENIDHWFFVRLDNEAGLSKQMVESDEIYSVDWRPLSELATCGFQNTKQKNKTVWDVRKVHERKLLSVNHAAKLISTLPRIPDIKLPENWEQFKENLRKFQNENSG